MKIKGSRISKQARGSLAFGCIAVAACGLCSGQAIVAVDLSKRINVLSDTAIGFVASTTDGNAFNTAEVPYLRTAGVTTPRYPGNHGVGDLYHWTTATTSKYKGVANAPYFAPESTFASFAKVAENLGNAVIVVNYGSNSDGTGGAEPAEAAAWVAYSNGDAASTQPLGKDSTGKDWQTIGYWATLRGDAPLTSDDGLNALRVHHTKPFGFKLWQVGDQIYNNGFFGSDHAGNPDLHGPIPSGPKDLGKLKKSPKLSPDAYAENFKVFAAAMKAVDPSIQIGVGFTTPPGGEQTAANWNHTVLKSACANIDFVSLDWQVGDTVGPDYKVLDEGSLFQKSRSDLATILRSLLDDYKASCTAGRKPRIALSSASPITWPKVEHPVVRALWIADIYTILIESGFLNIDWPEAYGDTMMSPDLKKLGPAFYGMQMIHIIAHSPGDMLVDATSSSSSLSVHAARRRDGIAGIMLVNLDPKSPATVKISLKGATVGTTGKRFDYGTKQLASDAPAEGSALTIPGGDFTITVPPYTVTDIVIPITK